MITWALLIWSGALLVWIIVGVIEIATKNCAPSTVFSEFLDSTYTDYADLKCFEIAALGKEHVAGAEALPKLGLWFSGVIVLAVIWFLGRPKLRICPHCGENVAMGLLACSNCGYDFTLARSPVHPSTSASVAPVAASVAPAASLVAAPGPGVSMPLQGWYGDAERPGRTRWWDGTAWGMRDDDHPSRVSVPVSEDAEAADLTPAVSDAPHLDAERAEEEEVEVVAAPRGSSTQAGLEPAVATTVEPISEAVQAATISSSPEVAADAPQTGRFCENCGVERRPGARFCSSCGHGH